MTFQRGFFEVLHSNLLPTMANIITKLSDYTRTDETRQVELVVYLASTSATFGTGIYLLAKQWDDINKRAKGKSASDNNLIIDQLKAKINNVLVKYRLREKSLTPQRLKEEVAKAPNLNFIDFIKEQLERKSIGKAEGTIKIYKSLITKLTQFRKEIFCEDINEDFILDFMNFMRVKLRNKETTVAKTITTLKQFVKLAQKKGLVTDYPFEDIHINKKSPESVFLTEDELSLLFNAYYGDKLNVSHKRVLRYFLFSAFTGLRLVDVKRVTKNNIIEKYLVVVPEKTKRTLKQVRIPIVDNAWRMINDAYGTHNKATLFDCHDSDNTTRRILKQICKIAGLNKNVTFHTARHTFATIFLRRNKNLRTLQALLGHSDIKETAKYCHVMNEDIEDQIKVFDEIFTPL
jgi:site-specific recombinase XerD